MQRNFENRLGQRIDILDQSLTSRSEQLGTALQQVQTGMQDLACRLLDIATSMQRLEIKLDSMAKSATCEENQQQPQKCASTSHAVLQPEAQTVQQSSTGGIGARCHAKTEVTLPEAEPIGTQEVAAWKGPQKMTEYEHALPNMIGGVLSGGSCGMLDGQSAATTLLHLCTKFGMIEQKLDRISASMGIKSGTDEGDDEEDRRRLKEKLKDAIDLDRRSRVHTIVSQRQVWLEYIFGICSPDQRIGKRGSR